MNQVIIDCCVQKDTRLMEPIANFNVSAITGEYMDMYNNKKNRFTYFRVIYPKPVTQEIIDLLQPGSVIRLYGKLDSEQYITKNNKTVYNKILCADRLVRIRYDQKTQSYIEVE